MGPLVELDDLQMTVHCAFMFCFVCLAFQVSVRGKFVCQSEAARHKEEGPVFSGERRLALAGHFGGLGRGLVVGRAVHVGVAVLVVGRVAAAAALVGVRAGAISLSGVGARAAALEGSDAGAGGGAGAGQTGHAGGRHCGEDEFGQSLVNVFKAPTAIVNVATRWQKTS